MVIENQEMVMEKWRNINGNVMENSFATSVETLTI